MTFIIKFIMRLFLKHFVLFLLFISISFIFSSCSTTKLSKAPIPKYGFDLPKNKENVDFLKIKSKIKINLPGQNASVNAVFKISGRDSLQMRILGPFGIEVVRFYSDKNKFIAYNIFDNKAFSGVPTAQALQRAVNIGLSFDELIAILRSELPSKKESYIFNSQDSISAKYVNKINGGAGVNRYCEICPGNRFCAYWDENDENMTSFKINLSDFILKNKHEFATKIEINLMQAQGSIIILIDDISFESPQNQRLSFTLPNSVELTEID
jgi:Domain of unknown function (DUF4292)